MFRKIQNAVCVGLVSVFALIWIFSKDLAVGVPAASGKVNTENNKKVIVLDAGHGGIDGGCVSVNGVAEKGINLSIVQTLRDSLEILGFDVVCTREDDRSIHDKGVEGIAKQKLSDMKNRAELVNRSERNILISIHQNKFEQSKYSGTQIFYSGNNEKSERLAESVRRSVTGLLQPDNKRELKKDSGSIYLLKNARVPAVIVECGFLSNPQEAQKLGTEKYQKEMAFAVMCGFMQYAQTEGINKNG